MKVCTKINTDTGWEIHKKLLLNNPEPYKVLLILSLSFHANSQLTARMTIEI
jgi:hypothetical protein